MLGYFRKQPSFTQLFGSIDVRGQIFIAKIEPSFTTVLA
jgi:hypothetical protein